MDTDLIARYDRRVPRYTSYPTAPHFHGRVDGAVYGAWLGELAPATPLSLYLHVPFCDTLCWFCGCHTKVVNRYEPVAGYLADLMAEIGLVAGRLGGRRPVHHVHFGGGSPTMLRPQDLERLGAVLRQRFAIAAGAEIAVEIDPRGLQPATVAALHAIGVNRVSFGLQDINPEVQQAINRIQPPATNWHAVEMARKAGIDAVNLDLIYGLPHQSVARVLATVEHAIALQPDRIALFGYAHVPAMKRHQRLISEAALPGAAERFAQAEAAAGRLVEAGYRRIGLDHFARAGDPMARAAEGGRLRRNFQGYSTDAAQTLIGFGASAIGTLPQGYVQNETDVVAWRSAVRRGDLPVARGVVLDEDDRLRRDIINGLMCNLAVDLGVQDDGSGFGRERDALAAMVTDGIVELTGDRVRVTEQGRPLVRNVAAIFDAYLDPEGARHSRAI
jgi:oxygen-independent coproporphyrinogen III oxidase